MGYLGSEYIETSIEKWWLFQIFHILFRCFFFQKRNIRFRIWLSVGRCVTFSAKKSGIFSCSGLFKQGVGCFEITESFNFSTVIVLKTVRLSDRQIWKHQLWISKIQLFFWTFSGYQRTFRSRVIWIFHTCFHHLNLEMLCSVRMYNEHFTKTLKVKKSPLG